MVSHQNLAHNLTYEHADMINSFRTTTGDHDCRIVSWLPQYHDMGLIGCYLVTIYSGGSAHFMSPVTFLKDPPCVFRLITKVKGTLYSVSNLIYSVFK